MGSLVIRVSKFFTERLHLATRRAAVYLFCITAIQVCMVSSVEAAYYTIHKLGLNSTITDVNNNKQFVGSTFVGSAVHATIWQDGTIYDLDILETNSSSARAINDNGWVVGQAVGSLAVRPILWRNGLMEDLGSLDGSSNSSGVAFDINVSGDIVGSSYVSEPAGSSSKAFLWQEGIMRNLGTLGGKESIALSINDSGQVAGWSADANNNTHAFLWQNDSMQDLGAMGRSYSIAKDINNLGWVIGVTRDVNATERGFLWKNGIMQDLELPVGYFASSAAAINDAGQIIINAFDENNQAHSLLWENGVAKDLCEITKCISAGWDQLVIATSINSNGDIAGHGYINGKSYGFLITVTAEPVNIPPEANVGLDQTVITNTVVQLDGSGSADSDMHYPLTYVWTITQKPAGSVSALSDHSIVNPIFITDERGDYVAELVVTDSKGLSSTVDKVVISTINSAPVANAGMDRLVVEHGSVVQLDGSASIDVDHDSLTYAWSLVERPAGSTVALNDASVVNPVFVTDVYGYYILQLVVTDSYGASSVVDEIKVSFKNILPVANAGLGQEVVVGDTVQLMGHGSDANLDPITYQWNIISIPDGSQVILPVASIRNFEFTPDVAGAYVLGLVVNDGLVNSISDNVMITVIGVQDAVFTKVSTLYDLVSAIDPGNFKKSKEQSKLLKKINKALDLIGMEKYRPALKRLQHDILRKTDGCFTKGAPEKNDWVRNCDAQTQLYPVTKEAIDLLQRLPETAHGMWGAQREDSKKQWKHMAGKREYKNRKDRGSRR